MTDVLLGGAVLGIAGMVAWVVHLARSQMIGDTTVRLLAAACALGLVIMLLSDWPSEVLATFWADHSVIGGILSTVLLVGVAFLAYEDSERRSQELLDRSVTAVGLGGIVDHMVDVEVALALISRAEPPSAHGWPQWRDPVKPLRWLREDRDRLERSDSGRPGPRDPRCFGTELQEVADPEWRIELLDQCVRRLLASIRDWSPVIRGSRNGTLVLIAISEIRKDLMELSEQVRVSRPEAETLLRVLRQRLRLLAHFSEKTSGARPLRPEVLTRLAPLPSWTDDLEWAADETGRGTFGPEWRTSLRATQEELQS